MKTPRLSKRAEGKLLSALVAAIARTGITEPREIGLVMAAFLRSQCPSCAANRRYQHERRASWRAEGRCLSCGNKPSRGRLRCSKCHKASLARMRRSRAG